MSLLIHLRVKFSAMFALQNTKQFYIKHLQGVFLLYVFIVEDHVELLHIKTLKHFFFSFIGGCYWCTLFCLSFLSNFTAALKFISSCKCHSDFSSHLNQMAPICRLAWQLKCHWAAPVPDRVHIKTVQILLLLKTDEQKNTRGQSESKFAQVDVN